MFQRYVGTHNYPQVLSINSLAHTTSVTGGVAQPWTLVAGGTARFTNDANIAMGGAAVSVSATSGIYMSKSLWSVAGHADMVSVCTIGGSLSGLPADAVVLAFRTSLVLGVTPALPFNDPTTVWWSVPLSSAVYQGTKLSVSFEHAFPVENNPNTRYTIGICIWCPTAMAAVPVWGALSIRQVRTEFQTFQPNK